MTARSSILGTVWLLLACHLYGEDTVGFRDLFNGKDLTGWCFRAKVDRKAPKVGEIVSSFDGKTESNDNGRYSAKDGILTVNFPKGVERLVSQLYTSAEFPKNFVLKLEFRA
eukprot:gene19657-24081_t